MDLANALKQARAAQADHRGGWPLRNARLEAALRDLVKAVQVDYFDPRRQQFASEHSDCLVEDGERWFGHGMPCRFPQFHDGEAADQ